MKCPFFSGTLSSAGLRFLLAAFVLTIAALLYAADSDIAEIKAKAQQGDADAQFSLGKLYMQGESVQKDPVEAVKWFRKAADQGDMLAQDSLGIMYRYGEGVPKDGAQAAKWFSKAAEQANASAQFELGIMYSEGEGVPQNHAEAIKWFLKAAEQGNVKAQYNLGFMYCEGGDVPQNYPEAIKWFQKAAEQGDVKAQYGLGIMYENGKGVPKNNAEAAKWYRKSAEQGNALAMHNLGVLYTNGQGLPQDFVQAYFWANLAAARGDEDASQMRESLSKRMTSAQIAQAQQMSANWQPKSSAAADKVETPPSQSDQPSTKPEQESQLQAGTGFVVSREGHVLTNSHVIQGCKKIVCDLGGKPTLLSVAQTDTRNDLALLRLDNPGPPPLKFREGKSIRSGDGIVVVGYPLQDLLANQAHVTTGTVSAMAGPGNDTRILQITAPVQPGNSGGPLFDMAGNVVGIVLAKLDAIKTAQLTGDFPQNVNFAINAAVVKLFLNTNGVEYESAGSNRKLEASEVGDIGKKATLPIVCSK